MLRQHARLCEALQIHCNNSMPTRPTHKPINEIAREAARKAAKLAASEQAAPGETTQISYEDEKGRWHNEVDSGTERPKTTVEG